MSEIESEIARPVMRQFTIFLISRLVRILIVKKLPIMPMIETISDTHPIRLTKKLKFFKIEIKKIIYENGINVH